MINIRLVQGGGSSNVGQITLWFRLSALALARSHQVASYEGIDTAKATSYTCNPSLSVAQEPGNITEFAPTDSILYFVATNMYFLLLLKDRHRLTLRQ